MTLKEFCERIQLQDELVKKVFELEESFDFAPYKQLINDLTEKEKSEDAYKALKEQLGEDPHGITILACYLKAALITYEKYQALGIDDEIYFDTMKSFTRFSDECLERQGYLGFVNSFWSYRHLNTNLMRIGALEFERVIRNGVLFISVHIPSNADLSKEALDDSFTRARAFLNEKFPECAEAQIYCESWLLYGGLKDVLPENSRILGFQSRFDVTRQNNVSKNALTYIFHRADCSDYQSLPEDTSLQRKVKALLLEGGGVGSAYGILKED